MSFQSSILKPLVLIAAVVVALPSTNAQSRTSDSFKKSLKKTVKQLKQMPKTMPRDARGHLNTARKAYRKTAPVRDLRDCVTNPLNGGPCRRTVGRVNSGLRSIDRQSGKVLDTAKRAGSMTRAVGIPTRTIAVLSAIKQVLYEHPSGRPARANHQGRHLLPLLGFTRDSTSRRITRPRRSCRSSMWNRNPDCEVSFPVASCTRRVLSTDRCRDRWTDCR